MSTQPVPEQIRKVFGSNSETFVPETGFAGRWRAGEVVFSRVDDATVATASARARERLELPGFRVARPMRGSDGRYVVGGWRADRYPDAVPQARPDEIVALAGTLGSAFASPRVGRLRSTSSWRPGEVFERALDAAWNGDPAKDLDSGLERNVAKGAQGFQADRAEALVAAAGMARLREQARVAVQPSSSGRAGEASRQGRPDGASHLDAVRSLRFDANGPLLTDVLLSAGPAQRGQAIAAVDLLAAGAAGEDLLWRWVALENWPVHVAGAMAFRLGVHALHPGSTDATYPGLRSAAGLVEHFVRSVHGI